jgi:hypothetical protein
VILGVLVRRACIDDERIGPELSQPELARLTGVAPVGSASGKGCVSIVIAELWSKSVGRQKRLRFYIGLRAFRFTPSETKAVERPASRFEEMIVPLSRTLCRRGCLAKQFGLAKASVAFACFAGLMAVAPPVAAVDGCLVLLCFAAPSWRAIPQCVPPIVKVLQDRQGKGIPTCSMSPGNSATPTANPPNYSAAVHAHDHDGKRPLHGASHRSTSTVP